MTETGLKESSETEKEKEPVFGVATTMPEDIPAPTATKPTGGAIDDVDESTGATEHELEVGEGHELSRPSSPLQYIFFAFVVLGVPAALFIYCGGLRWIKRRLSKRPAKGYKRVDDQDLEK